MVLFLATLIVLGAGLALLAVRIILVPGGEFRRRCAAADDGCPHCGRPAGEHCDDHGRQEKTGACAKSRPSVGC